jgi:hypothetical protein
MSDKAQKIKAIIKGVAPKSTFGTNPNDPWSAKYNVAESSDLEKYLKSKGINPAFVGTDTKIAHSKSGDFAKWKRDHQFEEVQTEQTATSKHTPTEIKKHELEKKAHKQKEIGSVGAKPWNQPNYNLSIKARQAAADRLNKEEVQIDEGKMGELHDTISRHVDKHISDFKSGHTGMDQFGSKVLAAHKAVAKEHGLEHKHAAKFVNDYVDSKLNEEVVSEADKHSFIGKIRRKQELKKKVDSTWKELGTAQKQGDHETASKAFRKHERYANLERPGTWTKVKEETDLNEVSDQTLDKAWHGRYQQALAAKHGSPEHQKAHKSMGKIGDVMKKRIDKKLTHMVKHDPEAYKKSAVDSAEQDRKRGWSTEERVCPICGQTPCNCTHISEDKFGKPTPSLEEIAKKHKVSMEELKKAHEEGVKVESEHTNDKNVADEIARDHLNEKPDYYKKLKKYVEDVFQDAQAATQTVFDGATNTDDTTQNKKREMSKSARMIKALYKKHKMVKEDLYDHEKEDKSVATYGKKPKMNTPDMDKNFGENKPDAAAVMSGGKTLTGEPRDDVEIDPLMRNVPNRLDDVKKADSDTKKSKQ